jgi:hypothetical protein
MLPRDKCLQALAELRHTKWFTAQAVGFAPTSVHFFPIPNPTTTKNLKENNKLVGLPFCGHEWIKIENYYIFCTGTEKDVSVDKEFKYF